MYKNDKKFNYFEISIVDYLRMIGEPIIKIGSNYYQHEQHDSLKINCQKNYFVWNSRRAEPNSKGGVLQYLQIMYGYTKKEAMQKVTKDLTGKDMIHEEVEKYYPSKFKYRNNEKTVPLEMQKYLVSKRKIPNRIVKHFFKLGLIAQNDREEIIFKWMKGNKIVGFSKDGTRKLTIEEKEKYHTKRDYIKYVAPTTKEDTFWGFNYLVGVPKKIYFFESAIDLLSFYTLFEKELITDFWLISIDGVTVDKIIHFLQYAANVMKKANHIEHIYLCFDNDPAGEEATKSALDKRAAIEEFVKRKLFSEFKPEQGKDWNEFLQLLFKRNQFY